MILVKCQNLFSRHTHTQKKTKKTETLKVENSAALL